MVGPFRVLSTVGNNAFKLDIPKATYPNSHNVFNVAALEPETNAQPGEAAHDGHDHASVDADGEVAFRVERILRHRIRMFGRGYRRQWLVRWAHHNSAHDTWEPLSHFTEDDGTVLDKLLKFEQLRLGDCRHLQLNTPPPTYLAGDADSTTTAPDGWVVFTCRDNATVASISRAHSLNLASIIDYNAEILPNINKRARFKAGTVVRIGPPTPANG